MKIGATAACTNIKMEAAKGVGQRYMKRATRYCFLFLSWLSLKKSSEVAVGVGTDIISMVKTNKMILKGGYLEYYKGLARRYLPSVEEQSYGASGKATNFYRIKV